MPNPYNGSSVIGCNSPAVGADNDTFTAVFDAAMAALDQHDHTAGRGVPIGSSALANAAVTAPKLASGAALSNLVDNTVPGAKLVDSTVTTAKLADGSAT